MGCSTNTNYLSIEGCVCTERSMRLSVSEHAHGSLLCVLARECTHGEWGRDGLTDSVKERVHLVKLKTFPWLAPCGMHSIWETNWTAWLYQYKLFKGQLHHFRRRWKNVVFFQTGGSSPSNKKRQLHKIDDGCLRKFSKRILLIFSQSYSLREFLLSESSSIFNPWKS